MDYGKAAYAIIADLTRTKAENATFLDIGWLNGFSVLTTDQIAAEAGNLKKHNIHHVMMDCGRLNDAGNFDRTVPAEEMAYSQTELIKWITTTRSVYPEAKLIGMVNRRNWRVSTRPVGFSLPAFMSGLNAEIETLLSLGLDGIHIDFEAQNQNDADILTVFDYLRARSLKGNRYVSYSAAPDVNWLSDAFLQELGTRINYINPMIYDQMNNGAPTAPEYTDVVRRCINYFANGIKGTGCKLVPILPSYGNNGDHDYTVENMDTALDGLEAAVSQGAQVDGVSIWWWPTYIGDVPTALPPANHLADQVNYLSRWGLTN